jgi:hypothetical protein
MEDSSSGNDVNSLEPVALSVVDAGGRDSRAYLKNISKSFLNAPMLLLLLAACFRHTGGYCWAYNTKLYFQQYHPEFEDQLGWWLFGCSVGGGSFGVFFGGFLSDRIVGTLGLHSRLWVLSGFTLLSVPFAFLTLYLNVRLTKLCF